MGSLDEIFRDNKPLTAKEIIEAERSEREAKTTRLGENPSCEGSAGTAANHEAA